MPTFTGSDNILMLNAEANSAGQFIECDFYNLIPSRFPPVDLYDRLTDDEQLRDMFKELEQRTNPRLLAIKRKQLDPDAGNKESKPYQNWNHAPFAYGDPDGSTYFSWHRPVLELYRDKQTALAVAVMRREAFLRSTSEPVQGVELRMLRRKITGMFADARFDPKEASQKERWKFGENAAEHGLGGVLFSPQERSSGEACAVLDSTLLGKAEQCEHYRCQWDGKKISSLYDFKKAENIDAALLGLENTVVS